MSEFGFKPLSRENTIAPPASFMYTTNATAAVLATYDSNSVFPHYLITAQSRLKKWSFPVSTNNVAATVKVALYETDSTGLAETTLIYVTTLNMTVSGSSPVMTDFLTDIDLSAYAGKYVKPVIGFTDNARISFRNLASGDAIRSSANFPDPFSGAANITAAILFTATIEETPLQAISVPATIAPGDTVTITPTGFTTPINSVTITDAAGNSIVRAVASNQFTMPAIASGTGLQFSGLTLNATNGTENASTTSTYIAATGYAYVDIATLSPAANSLYTQLMAQGLTLTTDDQLYSSTASNTEIFDDTTASSDLPNITVWVIQADGDVYEIAVTMGSGGIESVGITSPGITERGITTRGITSRGLN